MTEPQIPNRKDELLDELVNAKARRNILRQEYRNRKADHSMLEDQKDALEVQMKELQGKLTGVTQDWHQSNFEAKRIEQLGKDCSDEVSKLERELSRILDAEKLKRELAGRAQAFRQSCLTAAWRAESRSDGLGAKGYQIDGAVHLAVAQRAMLGDEMGLGKTLTALITCDMTDAKKVIVVCPSDTMHNFKRECILWTPHRFPVVLGQLSRMERDFLLEGLPSSEHFMLIVNYEAWRKDEELLPALKALKADTIIIDESHNIMHGETGAAKGVHELVFAGNYCPNCYNPVVKNLNNNNQAKCESCKHEADKWLFSTVQRVIPITGTGIMNKPQDLWSQLHIVDPANFPNNYAFLQDFCRKNPYTGRWEWQAGGESRLVKLIGPRYISRSQDDVGLELPPKRPVEHLITQKDFQEDYPKQWKAYQQARDYAQILLDPDRKIAMSMPNKITALLRLRQVLVWPAAIELVAEDEETGLKEIIAKLNVFESVKVDKAEEIIKRYVEQGDRVVVFSQFVDGIEELQRRLGQRSVLYYGKSSQGMKQAIQKDFDVKTASSTPRWDVVLAHYKSGGVGLNFNTVNHVIYLDPPWNPGTRDQAAGRARRIGSTADTIHVHDIRVERTVDTWMAGILTEKDKIIAGFDTETQDIYRKAWDALENGEM